MKPLIKSQAIVYAMERLLELSQSKYDLAVLNDQLFQAKEWRGVMLTCEELLDFASELPEDMGQVNTPIKGR
jgi:hypothetical protein